MFIKIYGERNTGTNYLERLIRLNFEGINLLRNTAPKYVYKIRSERVINLYFDLTRKKNLGWKHSCPEPELIRRFAETRPLLVLTLTKNPYSFLLSLYKKPYHTSARLGSFAAFLQASWRPVKRDRCPDISQPTELWNKKNAAYKRLNGQGLRILNLRYEDLVIDPESVIRSVARKMDIGLSGFRNVENSTKEKGKDFEFYQDYYQNERWREKLSPEEIEYINRQLDWDLVDYFGYDKIEGV